MYQLLFGRTGAPSHVSCRFSANSGGGDAAHPERGASNCASTLPIGWHVLRETNRKPASNFRPSFCNPPPPPRPLSLRILAGCQGKLVTWFVRGYVRCLGSF